MVIVCVNYSDVLKISLPHNLQLVDTICVVTNPDDQETINICEGLENVILVKTNRMFENESDKFNKGKALNEGIKSIKKDGWLLISDADTVLPKNFRSVLENNEINPSNTYGCRLRYLCPNHSEWIKYLEDERTVKEWSPRNCRMNIGAGFFQLVNCDHSTMKKNEGCWYNESFGHCGRSDRIFWKSFAGSEQPHLRGMYVVHLGDDKQGANWKGRTTKGFK